mmetsp:Transcript_2483/g.4367  ORF Transcript_2483/g.4367 Transcript_2483/m.4367 type:complete len:334 (-) Transcript_2483:532-1533(-)
MKLGLRHLYGAVIASLLFCLVLLGMYLKQRNAPSQSALRQKELRYIRDQYRLRGQDPVLHNAEDLSTIVKRANYQQAERIPNLIDSDPIIKAAIEQFMDSDLYKTMMDLLHPATDKIALQRRDALGKYFSLRIRTHWIQIGGGTKKSLMLDALTEKLIREHRIKLVVWDTDQAALDAAPVFIQDQVLVHAAPLHDLADNGKFATIPSSQGKNESTRVPLRAIEDVCRYLGVSIPVVMVVHELAGGFKAWKSLLSANMARFSPLLVFLHNDSYSNSTISFAQEIMKLAEYQPEKFDISLLDSYRIYSAPIFGKFKKIKKEEAKMNSFSGLQKNP